MTTPTPTDLPEAQSTTIQMALNALLQIQASNNLGPLEQTASQAISELRRLHAALAVPTTEQSSEVAQATWRSAVLDLIDDCPGLSMEQDQWLSRRVKELDFPSAAQTQAGAESYPLSDLTEDEWVELAARHANREWCSKYLDAIKATCRDFATAALRARGAVPSELLERTDRILMNASFESSYLKAMADNLRSDVRSMLVAAPQPPAALPGEQDAARAQVTLPCRACRDHSIPSKWAPACPVHSPVAAKGRTDGGEPA